MTVDTPSPFFFKVGSRSSGIKRGFPKSSRQPHGPAKGQQRQGQLRMAAFRQRAARYYDARVRPKTFRPGDLVLRRAEVSKQTEGGKLAPRWEGPYRVKETLHHGAYRVEELNGKSLPHTWNADNLRRYYQ